MEHHNSHHMNDIQLKSWNIEYSIPHYLDYKLFSLKINYYKELTVVGLLTSPIVIKYHFEFEKIDFFFKKNLTG